MKFPLVCLLFASVSALEVPDVKGMTAGLAVEDASKEHTSFRVQESCTTPYGSGTCVDTASCGGFSVAGYCSGSANIQCCITTSCSTPAGTGTCKENTKSCSGTYYGGYCPGPSNVQCCVASTGGGGSGTACTTPYGAGVCESTSACSGTAVPGYCPGDASNQCCINKISITAAQKGIDISVSLTAASASCWAPSIEFIIVRGYQSLGQVDSAVCTSLTSAYNAGIKYRDVYLFPCPTCSKSAATQMSELVSYLNSKCKTQFSGRIWLDIEGSQYWLGNTASNQAWYKVRDNSMMKVLILFDLFFPLCAFFDITIILGVGRLVQVVRLLVRRIFVRLSVECSLRLPQLLLW